MESEIERLRKVLKDLVDAYDGGHVRIDSPEIIGDDPEQPYAWHKEWLYHARNALGR